MDNVNYNIHEYFRLCHEQLLNLNNLYLTCYNLNLQMHHNFGTYLNHINNQNSNTQHNNRFSFTPQRTHWDNNFQRSSTMARPNNFYWDFNTRPSTISRRERNNVRRRRLNRTTPTTNNRWRWRTTTVPSNENYFENFWSNINETLNNSLYDSTPNNPLPNEDFMRETTHDSWVNIRTLLNLPTNTRCPITQQVFNDDDDVARIYHCGHVFNHSALRTWFDRDTRCPICRYDLRTNRGRQTTTTNPLSSTVFFNYSSVPTDLSSNTTNNEETNNTTVPETDTATNTATNTETDISSNAPSISWRQPIISPVNSTSFANTFSNNTNTYSNNTDSTLNSFINSLASELEENITNTIMDNSNNIMNFSSQVANSLLGNMSSNNTDWLTTELQFSFPTQLNSNNPFNVPTNVNENNTESKSEEKDEEKTSDNTEDQMD